MKLYAPLQHAQSSAMRIFSLLKSWTNPPGSGKRDSVPASAQGENPAGGPLPEPHLPLARFRLEFAVPQGAVWRGFAGSAWRGVLGHALKRLVCVARGIDCPDCLLYQSCVYPYIFETPPPPGAEKLSKYPAGPHPFVLAPPWRFDGGEVYELGLTLFGRAHRYLAYVVHALRSSAREGLSGAPRLELLSIRQQMAGGAWTQIFGQNGERLTPLPPEIPAVPPLPARLRLVFETPLRLRDGDGLITPERFAFADLFRNLLRRVSLLTYFHTDTPLETDFRGLSQASRRLEWSRRRLDWRDWTRYSSRQQERLKMGGLVGEAELSGEGLEPFWPYLWLGQWTHAGKGTSMGLGRYRIETHGKLAGDGSGEDAAAE